MEFLVWLNDSAVGTLVRESTWAYPGLLFIHTLGLAVLVGFNSAVDFRILGVAASRVPLDAMEPLFPLMWAGFWVNAVSGSILFIADAPKKVANPAFIVKMILILFAVGNMRALKRHMSSPGRAGKTLAALSLLLWIGATTAGRLMAYVGAF